MTLAPSLSLTLGNLRYDTQAIALHACLSALPRGSSAEVTLPVGVRFEAAPGDEAVLEADGGEGPSKVLTGKLRGVRRDLRGIRAIVADAASDLGALRPSKTFDKQNAAQVVKALASDAQVSAGSVELDLDLPAYVAHPRRTAAEHIAELARFGGAVAVTDADGRLSVRARPTGPATLALRYGREILDLSSIEQPAPNPQRFAVGFGPAGSASAPDARRESIGFLPADAAEGGPGVVRYPAPLLRTPAAALAASNALSTDMAARGLRLVARCFLLPALRPLDVLEIQSLPEGLPSGPWLLTRVVHELVPGSGGRTWLTAETASGSGLSGLLGAAVSAIGGLL